MAQPHPYTDLLDLLPKGQVESAVRLGLNLRPGMDRESWSRLVSSVVQTAGRTSSNRDTLTAWLGDLLAYGEAPYRGQITEYARAAGLAPGTLRDAKLVCSRIPVSCRRDALSWSHHCEIGKAFRTPADIAHWLKIAETGGPSKSELRRMIRAHLAGVRPEGRKAEGSVDVEPFALLRELRAVGRFVRNHGRKWTAWSPKACKLALAEIQPITELIEDLKARTEGAHS